MLLHIIIVIECNIDNNHGNYVALCCQHDDDDDDSTKFPESHSFSLFLSLLLSLTLSRQPSSGKSSRPNHVSTQS